MRVRFISGYYSDLAHKNKKRRPEDYWDAYFFCWLVKVGSFRRQFFIHDGTGAKTAVTTQNYKLARRIFGDWIEKSVEALGGGAEVVLVPIPSKDGIVGSGSFRSLDMTCEATGHTKYKKNVDGALRWKQKVTQAHVGERKSRHQLVPLLDADAGLKGKAVILVDDLLTKGSSMLAAADALRGAGANVLGAVVCGKTIYDLDTPHFGEQEFDLTGELADWSP